MNDVAATAGTALLELLGLLDDELLVLLLPQAARTRAALPATAVSPTLLVTEYKETTSLLGGTRYDADNQGQVRVTVAAGPELSSRTLSPFELTGR